LKFNILYIFWFVALAVFFYIGKNLQQQSGQQLFGIAETQGQTLKLEYNVFVQKSFVKVGQQVKKGDTLMLLFRSELDNRTTERVTELNQIEVERIAKNTSTEKDAELFSVRQTARISDLQAQIKVLESEIAVQENLRKAISENSNSVSSNIKLQEIKTLEEAIRQVNIQTTEQTKIFDSQRVSNNTISASKAQQIQNQLGFIGKEKLKLVLIAPFDGFVEQVFVLENEIAPNYKDLVSINPHEPNKVIGFAHESLNIRYRLGDTVILSSSLRPNITYKAQLVGASPKLVELPFRLRKNIEIKTWGRELYINLPPKNDFFIGEKVVITVIQ
jgi:DNA uptake protein ComE-like DNA-binding protein